MLFLQKKKALLKKNVNRTRDPPPFIANAIKIFHFLGILPLTNSLSFAIGHLGHCFTVFLVIWLFFVGDFAYFVPFGCFMPFLSISNVVLAHMPCCGHIGCVGV